MKCSLCGKENAAQAHAEHGIICDDCFDKQVPRCDFCSSRKVTWCYPANTFVSRDMPTTMVTDWAACDECHELIEDNDYASLAVRSLECYKGYSLTSDSDKRRLIELLGSLHQQFASNRTGPARREE